MKQRKKKKKKLCTTQEERKISNDDVGKNKSSHYIYNFQVYTIVYFNEFHTIKLTADPGFIGVQPGKGVITCPPVSVCQKVSAIEHCSFPISL